MKKELLTSLVGDLKSLLKTAFFHGYKKGLKDGVHRYAWMKDGVTYVGTCGSTLKEAHALIDKEENELRHIANQEVSKGDWEK